jgi:hypothetical protein
VVNQQHCNNRDIGDGLWNGTVLYAAAQERFGGMMKPDDETVVHFTLESRSQSVRTIEPVMSLDTFYGRLLSYESASMESSVKLVPHCDADDVTAFVL